jgi:hypothetical protein
MKAIKIILPIVAVAVIGVLAWYFWGEKPTPPSPPPPPVNLYVQRIQNQIEALKLMSDSKFCPNTDREIQYRIYDYHKQGLLGNTTNGDNDRWKEILSKNLYAEYSRKFIQQAFYVFTKAEWDAKALDTIRGEVATLQSSSFLQPGPNAQKFKEIQTILNKYNEIAKFISACKGYSVTTTDLNTEFPISEVENKIGQAKTYLKDNLGNSYVKNCTRLTEGLKTVPQALFKAHVKYLDNKMDAWKGKCSSFKTQKEFKSLLWDILKSEINALDNNIYNVSNFDAEYERLEDRWDDEGWKAYKTCFNPQTIGGEK